MAEKREQENRIGEIDSRRRSTSSVFVWLLGLFVLVIVVLLLLPAVQMAGKGRPGDGVFEGFDEAGLRMILQHGKDLPPAEDLAAMLHNVLDDEGKTKIMVFLSKIASADGNVSPEERDLLQRSASA